MNNWYIGISLKNNSDDKIEFIEFYNYYEKQTYFHHSTSKDNEKFSFTRNITLEEFDDWKDSINIYFSISTSKFNELKNINTSLHTSVKRFLKAFSLEEFLI